MKKYYIKTYGCQMNVADSTKLAGVLESAGWQEAQAQEQAEIILVNTCCVREHAENRALGFIASLKNLKKKNPNSIIGVCGCIPVEPEMDIKKRFPHVDLTFGPNQPEKLAEHLSRVSRLRRAQSSRLESRVKTRPVTRDTGLVTIMHGCDNFCSYCIVPYVRGREYSRPIPEVHEEIRQLVEQGATEITLLGQNVNSYKYGLANLLRAIKAFIPLPLGEGGMLERQRVRAGVIIRFLTSHPRDMSDEIIEAVHELPFVAKEFLLPLQSGDDIILKKMNRGYTLEHFLGRVKKIRSLMPEARITTDILIGFPGETEEQFENTLRAIETIKFGEVHMFAYSARPETAAAKLPDQLPKEIKQARLQKLQKMVREVVRK